MRQGQARIGDTRSTTNYAAVFAATSTVLIGSLLFDTSIILTGISQPRRHLLEASFAHGGGGVTCSSGCVCEDGNGVM